MDTHLSQQHLERAIAAYGKRDLNLTDRECRAAIDAHSSNADAIELLGLTRFQQGHADEGCELVQQAIALNPTHARYHGNIGLLLGATGQHAEAARAFENALRLQPDQPESLNNLATTLRKLDRNDEAIDRLKRAIEVRPDFVEAHYNLGNALKDAQRLDEAIAAFESCLRLRPDFPPAMSNLGVALTETGQIERSIELTRHALRLRADPKIGSTLLRSLHYASDASPQAIFDAHLQWNQKYAAWAPAIVDRHTNEASTHRRLRVGYVSADFVTHPVGSALVPILENHDHLAFEIICYSDVRRADAQTQRLQRHADVWRETAHLPDEDLAQLIADDHVDVLIDLAVHNTGNRLLTFARKPAPVQITWAGWPGTTGMSAMDYRISDPYLDPPNATPGLYSERTIQMPHSFWCFNVPDDAPEVGPAPFEQSGVITFGSVNNFCKINELTVQIWADVLHAVLDSRMLILAPQGIARDRLAETFAGHGIDRDRLEFLDRQPRRKYLEFFHRIDICLDTVPYGGHTTTIDALFMGTPVVTMAGEIPVWRAGLSILNNVKLPELVADRPEDYVQTAQHLAADRGKLAGLRRSLRQKLLDSPIADGKRFARDLEAVYRSAWSNWVASVTAQAANAK